jgi:ATP-dependent Clp protease protease subunit
MVKRKTNKAEIQDNSLMENHLNWLINGVDLENRRIEMRGEVGEGMSSFLTRALLKMTELGPEPVEVYLSSYGGDVYEGLAIYDALVACPCDIHMIASGKIMSAGFIIFLGGDKRTAAPHTSFMAHSVSYSAEGTAKDHEIQVNEGKRINSIFTNIAAKRTRRDKKWWSRAALTHDKFLNVEEATQLGIINTTRAMKEAGPAKKVKKKVVKKAKKVRRK